MSQVPSKIFFCSYTNNSSGDGLCDLFQVNSSNLKKDEGAQSIINSILQPIGLPSNFILVSCSNIENCAAITGDDGIRYIVYDVAFMKNISKNTSNWSNVSILAHELGHHLSDHTLKRSVNSLESRNNELQADEFSGFVLKKLGATLFQAQSAIMLLGDENESSESTHPKKERRLLAIAAGYNKANMYNLPQTTSFENFYLEAKELLIKGNYSESILKFTKLIVDNPKFANAFYFRAACKHYLRLYEEALVDYTTAIKLNNNVGTFYYDRGLSYSALSNLDASKKDYEKALSLLLKTDGNYYLLGEVESKLKNYSAAINYFDKAIKLNSSADAYASRGIAKGSLKDYNGSLEDLNTAIKLDKTESRYYHARGRTKLFQRNYADAIEDYTKSIELNSNSYKDFMDRAECRVMLGKNSEAILDLNEAIKLDDSNYRIYQLRGVSFESFKKYEAALSDLNTAVQKNKNIFSSYFYRGRIRGSMGDYEGELSDYMTGYKIRNSDKSWNSEIILNLKSRVNAKNSADALNFIKKVESGSN